MPLHPRLPALVRLAASLALTLPASAATYVVNSISALQTRINSAVAGDIIILENGTYTTSAALTVNRTATAANPITIAAESIGGVTIAGSHGFTVNSPAAHIEIEGFRFTHQAGRNAINSGATFVRFTRNIFECSGEGNYLVISGDDTRIDRNTFRNKSTVGNMIDVRGSGSQVARRVWIHHNYFHDFAPAGANGAETIRFGLSGLSMSTGNGLVEHNLFVRCRGENELISNKSSGNTFRYNTFLDSAGGELSQRHGNDCLIYGNYFHDTAGIRIYGDRHQIFSNHLEGNSLGITIGNGAGEVADGAALTTHDRPDDCAITFNTLVNNSVHYQMGGRTNGLGATGTVFANNIIQGGGTAVSISGTAPYASPVWSGNLIWNVSSVGNIPSGGYTSTNPLLAAGANGVFRLQSGSPAIDAATGSHPAVTVDMEGQPRTGAKDKGADEFSSAFAPARILAAADVGHASPSQTATPAFSPAGGTFGGAQTVTLTTATPGASIRYTTNGSNPSPTSGTLYTSPVAIGTTTTLRAIAYLDGLANSTIASATYTISSGGGSTTVTSADGFFNRALGSTQTGTFTATFTATSSISPANAVVGFSLGNATGYTSIAAMVRFNTTGIIDARNGGGFTGSVPFSANTAYAFRLVINVPARTYSAYVTGPSGGEQTIGTNLAFRTEQSGVTSLDNAVFNVNPGVGGSLTVGPIAISGGGTPAKFALAGGAVTASADDGNVPANTVDGSLATRWSANGDGQWIRYDLGSTRTVASVKIAFYNGDVRTSSFDLQVSNDGSSWTTVASPTSGGTSLALETFDFTDASARYVRILGHGNSVNLWNSYTEVEIWGF